MIKRHSRSGIWQLAFGIWYFSIALSQDVSFSASVDRAKVAMGEHFEITFSLAGTTSGQNFRPPSFNDFIVLSGPNQSTSMQFINGRSSSSIAYTYVLQPRAQGRFTIAPAFADIAGKRLQTQPVTIEVTKGSKQTTPGSQEPDISRQIGDNLFLKAVVDKHRVYQGEQVTATYKLYTRVNVVNYGIPKAPSLIGFWSEDLLGQKQIKTSEEVVDGRRYRVGVLKKVALFPQRSGTLEIDPIEVECVVQVQTRRRTNNLFDQFFSDPFFGNVTNVTYGVRSEPVKIMVQPLPAVNVPAGFTRAVGKYSMEAWLDKRQTKTDDPVTLKVKISGRGNLKLLTPPPVTTPSDLERYDPKISDNISSQGDQIGGARTFEYLLIPRYPGEQRIPSFPFSYFDVEKKAYVTLTSPEFLLEVERGSDLAPRSASGLHREDVKLLAEDIRFIKSCDIGLRRAGERFAGSPAFFALTTAPLLSFIGFVVYAKRREKVLGDPLTRRSRHAGKLAQKRLADARRFLRAGKKEELYTEISRALWKYAADKLGLSHAELSIDALRSSLILRKVSEETTTKVLSTMEQYELARFSPMATSLPVESAYREAVDLISILEDELG